MSALILKFEDPIKYNLFDMWTCGPVNKLVNFHISYKAGNLVSSWVQGRFKIFLDPTQKKEEKVGRSTYTQPRNENVDTAVLEFT